MKVAPTVRAGGKGSDNVKPLPICHQYQELISSSFSYATNVRLVEEGNS